ncbi:MAG: hypothetical protein ACQEXB_12565 [Bacillota bacterium]
MVLSSRIKKKIYQYSMISKAVGIIDEQELYQIINHLTNGKQHGQE